MKGLMHDIQGGYPPFFVDPLTPRDRNILPRIMKGRNFSLDTVCGAAVRCEHGFPQVLLCYPFKKNSPFPTTLWLVCPWLQRVCASLESQGGVGALERHIVSRTSLWVAWHMEHVLLRLAFLEPPRLAFLGRYRRARKKAMLRGGIGGARFRVPPRVKCLHLQAASYRALGWHPGEDWLEERVPSWSCASPGECFSYVDSERGKRA